MKNLKRIILFSLFVSFNFLLLGCGKIDRILMEPKITPEEFLQTVPYIKLNLFSKSFILTQPTSTFLIYLLSAVSFIAGIHFLKTRRDEKSRFWWGIAMLLWGISAFCAGTSYQAFTYELKCAGREYCIWTSWWEIFYLLFTVWSVNALVVGQSFNSAKGTLRKKLQIYAGISSILYLIVIIMGVILTNWFMISFELLVIFFLPTGVIFVLLNYSQYRKLSDKMNLNILYSWGLMALSMVAYYIFYLQELTQKIWKAGYWFSDNDMLHVILIIWMLHIRFVVAKYVKDIEEK